MTDVEQSQNFARDALSTAAPTTADPRRWKALAVLALIQFMLILDVTVVNVALPRIQHDLGFSRAGLAWVVNGYVLMAGGFVLLGGRMADILGRRRLFLLGVALFAVASATCGAAVDPGCSSRLGSFRAWVRRSPRRRRSG
jgi:MFS family permease